MIVYTAQDVLVYLFGDSAVHLSVEGLGSVTVQELGRSVREALHVPESAQDAFAFWLCSPLLGKNFAQWAQMIKTSYIFKVSQGPEQGNKAYHSFIFYFFHTPQNCS